jgi:hypothetical protein
MEKFFALFCFKNLEIWKLFKPLLSLLMLSKLTLSANHFIISKSTMIAVFLPLPWREMILFKSKKIQIDHGIIRILLFDDARWLHLEGRLRTDRRLDHIISLLLLFQRFMALTLLLEESYLICMLHLMNLRPHLPHCLTVLLL